MIYKVDNPDLCNSKIRKALNELYKLEDITQYNNKELGRIISKLQKITFTYEVY